MTSNPAGISCEVTDGEIGLTSVCSAFFDEVEDVTLSVVEGNTTVFEGWSGDCDGTGSCMVPMNANRSVTAALPRRAIIAVDGSNELSFVTSEGSSPPSQEKTIRNRGDKTLEYNASFNQTWLSVSPLASGSVPPGGEITVSVVVDSDELSPGSYQGQITLTDPEAGNSPRFLEVSLTVN